MTERSEDMQMTTAFDPNGDALGTVMPRQYPAGGDPNTWCKCGHHKLNHAFYADLPKACNQTGCECRNYELAGGEVPTRPQAYSVAAYDVSEMDAYIDHLESQHAKDGQRIAELEAALDLASNPASLAIAMNMNHVS